MFSDRDVILNKFSSARLIPCTCQNDDIFLLNLFRLNRAHKGTFNTSLLPLKGVLSCHYS